MKFFILLALCAIAAAYPQGGGGGGGDGHGFKIHHEDRGHEKKHPFFEKGDGDSHHHGTSYLEIKRHDSKDHPVHLKAHPEYHYGFKVLDEHTKDLKSKHEERDGHKVKGKYTLLEPDGKTIRIVEYTADKKEGFQAKVSWKHHH